LIAAAGNPVDGTGQIIHDGSRLCDALRLSIRARRHLLARRCDSRSRVAGFGGGGRHFGTGHGKAAGGPTHLADNPVQAAHHLVDSRAHAVEFLDGGIE
jgi:hypothetical protein